VLFTRVFLLSLTLSFRCSFRHAIVFIFVTLLFSFCGKQCFSAKSPASRFLFPSLRAILSTAFFSIPSFHTTLILFFVLFRLVFLSLACFSSRSSRAFRKRKRIQSLKTFLKIGSVN